MTRAFPHLILHQRAFRNGPRPQHVSDVKSRISFYTAWMAIHNTDAVAGAYDAFVRAAQTEAGQQMTAAWRSTRVPQLMGTRGR